ncbi:MAG TPA: hypothetical protein VF824_14170 [Thermoanaerobaculia bacterium]|jgi:hypothetical protein
MHERVVSWAMRRFGATHDEAAMLVGRAAAVAKSDEVGMLAAFTCVVARAWWRESGRAERALARMPVRLREIARLHYLEGRRVEEIAAASGAAAHEVAHLLRHVRRRYAAP